MLNSDLKHHDNTVYYSYQQSNKQSIIIQTIRCDSLLSFNHSWRIFRDLSMHPCHPVTFTRSQHATH